MIAESISPVAVLRDIFVQLLRLVDTDWMSDFEELTSRKDRGRGPPSGLHEYVDLIRKVSKKVIRAVIAVDGLDECNVNPDRVTLARCLRDLAQVQGLSLFVTSRDEQDFHDAFQDLASISLTNVRENIEADIRAFVADELQTHTRLCALREELKNEILDVLVNKAEGMYVSFLRSLIWLSLPDVQVSMGSVSDYHHQ